MNTERESSSVMRYSNITCQSLTQDTTTGRKTSFSLSSTYPEKLWWKVTLNNFSKFLDFFPGYLIDCLIQFVENYQIQELLIIAFYDENIWLANCEMETRIDHARNKRTLPDIKLIQLIENTDQDPFNVAICEDVYFDSVGERELTLKLLQTAKNFIEEKTN